MLSAARTLASISVSTRAIKRVIFVLQSTAIGGMESHCVDLAREYQRRGIAVLAVVPRNQALDALAERFRAAGVGVERLSTDARDGRIGQIRQLADFVRCSARFHPDVVHVQTGGATGGTAVIVAARLMGTTAVITEHDVPGERPTRSAQASRFVLDRLAHAVVAVSRRNANLRTARIPPIQSRFAVVLNGVPLPALDEATRITNRESVRAALGIPESQVVLGSVVRLADGKGLHDLLNAIAKLKDDGVSCDLLLVGDGPLRAELETMCDTIGIGDRVHFAGNQPDPGRLVDAFDAFVLAVPAGSMSIALLEAMARGVPPAITFCGPEEAVRPLETGVCATPNDPIGLARALASLVRDPKLRTRLGSAAAAHVRRHYSVARVADDLLDIYEGGRHGALPSPLAASAPFDPKPGDRMSGGKARPSGN
jgi:glycosyltransferase involved in cell wall biosynthesis